MADEHSTSTVSGSRTAQLSGAAFVPPSVEELGALLPEFEFISLIGVGGMSAVYLVRRVADGDALAIKVMSPPNEDHEDVARRFVEEAETMARLVHPHIVPVYEFGQTSGGHLFIVMEYVDGADLHRVIHAGGVNPGNAHGLIRQLCEAVQYAHDQGIAHRDIKPANILITKEGCLKVTDFGVAEDLIELAAGDDGYGTPDYTAPERTIVGAVVDHRSDVYSLGVVIHEMLTGETPRQAARHGGAKLPDSFTGVMSKCLMIDPARRYQSAREVGAALSLAIEEEREARRAEAAEKPPAVIKPVPLARPVDLGRRGRPWLADLGWALACVVVVSVIVFFEWQKRHPLPDGTLPTFKDAVHALIQSIHPSPQTP